jgi:hypothetical protein
VATVPLALLLCAKSRSQTPSSLKADSGVTPDGFREAGRALGTCGLPTVLVQEGGYALDSISGLVNETLLGLEEGLAR